MTVWRTPLAEAVIGASPDCRGGPQTSPPRMVPHAPWFGSGDPVGSLVPSGAGQSCDGVYGGVRLRCFIACHRCTPDTCDAQRQRRSRARSTATKNIANERGRVPRKQRTKKRCARTGNEQPRQRGRSRRTVEGPT